jgi:hypothetical protein
MILLKMMTEHFFFFVRNSVRLAIRKVMYAPSKPGEQPSVEVSKDFMMSPSKLHLECSLDKVSKYLVGSSWLHTIQQFQKKLC